MNIPENIKLRNTLINGGTTTLTRSLANNPCGWVTLSRILGGNHAYGLDGV